MTHDMQWAMTFHPNMVCVEVPGSRQNNVCTIRVLLNNVRLNKILNSVWKKCQAIWLACPALYWWILSIFCYFLTIAELTYPCYNTGVLLTSRPHYQHVHRTSLATPSHNHCVDTSHYIACSSFVCCTIFCHNPYIYEWQHIILVIMNWRLWLATDNANTVLYRK